MEAAAIENGGAPLVPSRSINRKTFENMRALIDELRYRMER
jgi:hypothetical protein